MTRSTLSALLIFIVSVALAIGMTAWAIADNKPGEQQTQQQSGS